MPLFLYQYIWVLMIYLVGCDYTHENSRMGHWYEMGKGTLVIHKDYEKNF